MNRVPVGRDTVVSLQVEMYDAQGALLGAPAEPLTYLHGGYGGLLDALEALLDGHAAGDAIQAQLEPEQAFGEYDADLLRIEPLERYGSGVQPGMAVEEDERIYTVTDVADGKVVLDGNHPLAGMAVRFNLKIIGVRSATEEEIERGVSSP